MKSWQTRLHMSIEIHAPVLLLPQKSTSPNLIVLNMGTNFDFEYNKDLLY